MMFDQNLFFALCEKYNVELSSSATEPMIKDENGVHAVSSGDLIQIANRESTTYTDII